MAEKTKTKQTAAAAKTGGKNAESDAKMALGMRNYILMLTGFVLVVAGFALMTGGGSSDPDEFNYEMFSFRRITLSTIVALGGFALVAFGIMSKGCKKKGIEE